MLVDYSMQGEKSITLIWVTWIEPNSYCWYKIFTWWRTVCCHDDSVEELKHSDEIYYDFPGIFCIIAKILIGNCHFPIFFLHHWNGHIESKRWAIQTQIKLKHWLIHNWNVFFICCPQFTVTINTHISFKILSTIIISCNANVNEKENRTFEKL